MQYGAEVFPYQRVEKLPKEQNKHKKIDISQMITIGAYFAAGLFISRVVMANFMAPFGVAFLIAVVIQNKELISLSAGCGTLLGYASLLNSSINNKYVENLGAYFIVTGSIILIGYVFRNIDRYKQIILNLAVIYIEFASYKLFRGITPGISFFTTFFEVGCILPIYFIINSSLICFKEFKVKHLFSNEETISMAITASLLVAGTWGINIYGISIRNIFSITLVIILGYIKGSETGAACGVALGTIIGITSSNVIAYIAVYGLCGLIVGVFKETGKIWSAISFLIAFSILKMYSNLGEQFKIIEALIAFTIFIIISSKIYNKLALDLDFNGDISANKSIYYERIKDVLMDKVKDFSGILGNVSDTLERLVENDKLDMRNKSAGLVENLADRVCSNCNMNSMCWKRESFYTYNGFAQLIQNYQEKKNEIPYEINRKCVRRTELSRNTEDIVNNYIVNEIWRAKSSECRKVLAGQINSMSGSILQIINYVNENIKFNNSMENDIRRVLNRTHIKFRDVVCYSNRNNRIIVKLTMEACGGRQMCIKRVLPLINEVTGRCMCVSEDGCNVDVNNGTCSISFEDAPKYHVASYVSRACKDGEKCSGDSYSFGKLSDGSYLTIISDGMGSGPRAGEESSATVELIKKFADVGFDKMNAINIVNSILSIKFSEDDKFSTVDLNSMDLYTGETNFIKVGSAASFIKKGSDVEIINSKTLPIGVLDKLDIEIIEKKVDSGDIIVMLSDGILDYNSEALGKTDWVADYLRTSDCNDPKELSRKILEKAKEFGGGKVKDDMTVVASKIYKLY